ncbi:LETM1 domain-containing protein 1 [Megalops cyprinoides]|uniref:LETM1 domain-containing protein 1 n=1 Tax=Megalops cyprinoides TaxID=118141 RepID=UPI001863C7F0|nr:LETM1 domain-containing protein 1 [Megalops cyprinoides]
MALSWVGVCRGSALLVLYGMRPIGVTASLCSPIPVSTRVSLSICRRYSSSKARLGLGRRVVTRLQWANEKYERFLQRRFPRFYVLYHTFMRGFRLLFQDAKEVRKIKMKTLSGGVQFHQLPYREMETLRQFRRDLIKAIPLVLISVPPFANYLVFVLMYLFPRQLLIRHFWTPQQQVEFQGVYHARRAQHHGAIVQGITRAVPRVQNQQQQSLLLDLCNKVQNGAHPSVSEIQAVRGLFSGPPLGMKRLDTDHMRLLCSQLFLTPHLPAFLIRQRLSGHALELLQLDRALNRLGLHQLSDAELRQACYVRGLYANGLSAKQCREWLSHWLQLSTRLKESEASLLLHGMVLLSVNSLRLFHR